MAWSLADSATTTFADGNAGHVYTFPGAAVAGDIILLGINSNTTVTTPSGFTAALSDVAHMGAYAYYKVATGGETAVTITTSGNHNTALSFLRYSGGTGVPLDVTTAVHVLDSPSPQASPAVTPSALAGTGELCVLYGMAHNSSSAVAISGITPSVGYSSLLTTAAAGGLNTSTSAMHFVIGRTDGTGSQTPSVAWTGGDWQNITSLFVSFRPAAVISPTGIPSAEAFGALTVVRDSQSLWTLTTDVIAYYWQSPSPYKGTQPSNRIRYRIPVGASMLRIAGVWRAVADPSAELIATADRAYAGGRIFTIPVVEAAQLISQGFGDHVVEGA